MLKHEQESALRILHNLALERRGWLGFFARWFISAEPLRNDAANLLRRLHVPVDFPKPDGTRYVGDK